MNFLKTPESRNIFFFILKQIKDGTDSGNNYIGGRKGREMWNSLYLYKTFAPDPRTFRGRDIHITSFKSLMSSRVFPESAQEIGPTSCSFQT